MEMQVLLATLLPLACAWAEKQERHALSVGVALTNEETAMATAIGVEHPERVRILEVARIPMPEDKALRLAAENAGLSLEHSGGMALQYGIFIRADQPGRQETIAHELTHVAQHERLGGFEGFLRRYFTQCLTVGYRHSPLELEAVRSARRHVHE